jgi:hypothetical protein
MTRKILAKQNPIKAGPLGKTDITFSDDSDEDHF